MKIKALILMMICSLLLLAGCASSSTAGNQKGQIVIGVSLQSFSDKFTTYIMQGMKEASSKNKNIKVIYVDAQNDSAKQLSQVETFIEQGVNAIVVKPVDTEAMDPMLEQAKDAKIPLIGVNALFKGVKKAASFVGSDSKEAGILEMEAVAKLLNGKGNIAIMDGGLGHEAQINRTAGYKEVIAKYPDMKIVSEATAEWDRSKAMNLMENWLSSGRKIDAVVANNDEMAIGAQNTIKAAGKQGQIVVAGVDATPDALDYIKSGALNVTVFQDAKGQGGMAIETAIKAAKGEKVEKLNWIPYQVVTKDNVDQFVQKWK
ncbi:sugar ABC transporter substrate-binding protein [Ectobacillus funiculus]|uniref:Sugar ABC transporter substrate-binding protein n=1 Tax=Ectobacillus funiculus TaxID=137993 RepID=A0ABV5W9A6_9BACI